MTFVPLPVRPAATVMLLRDDHTPRRSTVFLMRRHAEMEFAPGTMVFPGGGVDDRDRNADIAWAGPAAAVVGAALRHRRPSWPRRWCAPRPRETFEESGVLFAGPADDPAGIVGDASVYGDARRALAERTLSFADFLRRENLVLRADLLRPWANWVTPEAERTRRYDTYFFVGALPEGQRADGDNTESDRRGWTTPQAAIADFEAGRCFLLPPTWTQLDSLIGRTVADVLAVERQIVTGATEPSKSKATTGFSSSSTPTAITGPAKRAGWDGGFERVRQRPPRRRASRASGRWCSRGPRPMR